MTRTFIRQETQIRNSDGYVGNLAPGAGLETGAVNIEDDLNGLRSMVALLRDVQTSAWHQDLLAPVTFEGGVKRGVQSLNQELHDLERKRVLTSAVSLADVTVGAGENFIVLSGAQLPSNTTAAVGAVTTLGTVVSAHGGTFGTHSLSEVSGATAISPKNLCLVVDGQTRDPVLSSGRQVYGLAQSESSADGHTLSGSSPNRLQISFVRINGGGDDLEAVPFADIENRVVNYVSVTRKALEDLTEQDFLRGAEVDVPAAATVTRQVAYDNQGTAAVDVTTNSVLDLESPGVSWSIRDDEEDLLFAVVEGSGSGTSEVRIGSAVDLLNVDAAVNDFFAGLRVDTGGQRINIGESPGVIETTSGGDLRLLSAGDMFLDDANQSGSTWAQTSGIKLSSSAGEWNDFESEFGEVSLLRAVYLAKTSGGGSGRGAKAYTAIASTISPNTDVSVGVDMSSGSFLLDYDVFVNGQLLRPGADSSADFDYYPGTSLAAGQLRFEFRLRPNDVICVVPYAA